MIVNLHDGPWRCNACSTLYTRRVAECQRCHSTAIQKADLVVAWGDDVTAICQGLVAIQGEGKASESPKPSDPRPPPALGTWEDMMKTALGDAAKLLPREPAKPSPCQPDPFPMQQSAALAAILESWRAPQAGLVDHVEEILRKGDLLAHVASYLASALRRERVGSPEHV